MLLSQFKKSSLVQNYTLTASAAGEKFKQTVQIFTVTKAYSVLIQTDKPLYKPGDKVKFRVLITNDEMKPYQVDELKVELSDALDNVVSFHDGEAEDLEKGVFVNEFEIATEPVMGEWKIRVISKSKNQEKVTEQKFEVKEYILPRFEVIVDTKHDVTKDQSPVRLMVSALYTFGELVKGKAVATAKVYDTQFPEIVQQTSSKTVDVDGNVKKMIEFHMANDLKIYNEIRPYEVKFTVEFEESLTGQKLTGNATVRIHKTGENYLEIVGQKRIKPGYPYNLNVIVRKFDGSLSDEKFAPVKLSIKYHYKAPYCTPLAEVPNLDKHFESSKQANLKSGIAGFTLNVAPNTTAMSITASFQDVKASLNVARHESRSREYLLIKSLTKR